MDARKVNPHSWPRKGRPDDLTKTYITVQTTLDITSSIGVAEMGFTMVLVGRRSAPEDGRGWHPTMTHDIPRVITLASPARALSGQGGDIRPLGSWPNVRRWGRRNIHLQI